jgi:hypothetical protein
MKHWRSLVLARLRLRHFGVCVSLLSVCACGSSDDRFARLRAEALARHEMQVEEQAQLDALEAELQRERYLAEIAPIENDRGEPPRLLSSEELETLLGYYCGECHGLDNVDFGITFETVEDLIEFQRMIPGNAATSRVMVRMQAGEMPPLQAGLPPVPPATIQLIADFIDSLPAPTPSGD